MRKFAVITMIASLLLTGCYNNLKFETWEEAEKILSAEMSIVKKGIRYSLVEELVLI